MGSISDSSLINRSRSPCSISKLFQLFHLHGYLRPQSLNLPLKFILFVSYLIALDFKRIDLLILYNMQVLLHLQLPLQLSQIISIAFLNGNYIFFSLKIRHALLLQIDQDVVLQLLYILPPRLELLLGLVQKRLQLSHSQLLIYLWSVLYLFSRNTEPQRRNSLRKIVGMRRTSHYQSGLRIATQRLL